MKYLSGFDGLRGISILLVVTTHLGFLDQLDFDNYWIKRLLTLISGGTGVNIFFSLSGFLITKILIEEKTTTGAINFKNFFARRFLRLAPPLILFYLVMLILMYYEAVAASYVGLLFGFFYVFNFIPNRYYTSELGHLWSLAVEEQFYVVWPFVISLVNRNVKIIITILILTSCFLAQMILPTISITYGEKAYWLKQNFELLRWFFPAVSPIIIGSIIYLARYYAKGDLAIFLSYKRLHVIGLFLFLCPLVLPDVILAYVSAIQAVGVSLMLVWLSNNQSSRLSVILSFYPLAYLGKISYGIYVYHGLFIRTGPGGSLWVQHFPVNVLMTLFVSVISFVFFEKRILKLKEGFR